MRNEDTLIIKQVMDSREELFWAGKPKQGLTLRPSDATMIPFSLLWGGFAIFWEYMVVTGTSNLFGMIWGIPFVLVGLYLIFGRFVFDSWQREGTVYGITDQRVIIVSELFSRKTISLDISKLQSVTLQLKADESGTITFNAGAPQSSFTITWGNRRREPEAPAFEMIQDAQKVYLIIREAQRRTA